MTKPDFEAIASRRLTGKQVISGGLPYTRQMGEIFAQALNDAYAAGEKSGFDAGLERAAEIAVEQADKLHAAGGIWSHKGIGAHFSAAIRAELRKEKTDG